MQDQVFPVPTSDACEKGAIVGSRYPRLTDQSLRRECAQVEGLQNKERKRHHNHQWVRNKFIGVFVEPRSRPRRVRSTNPSIVELNGTVRFAEATFYDYCRDALLTEFRGFDTSECGRPASALVDSMWTPWMLGQSAGLAFHCLHGSAFHALDRQDYPLYRSSPFVFPDLCLCTDILLLPAMTSEQYRYAHLVYQGPDCSYCVVTIVCLSRIWRPRLECRLGCFSVDFTVRDCPLSLVSTARAVSRCALPKRHLLLLSDLRMHSLSDSF